MSLDLDALARDLASIDPTEARGKVRSVVGLRIEALLPGARLGDRVEVHRPGHPPLACEVVGLGDDGATLMPLGDPAGLAAGDSVVRAGLPLALAASEALLGRVLDGLGAPIDGGPALTGAPFALTRPPPDPLRRPRIDRPLATGVRAIDGVLTLGEGQRVGLFAGSGVGKSSLLADIARHAEADVFVACLVGERGREVREFVEDVLGEEGRRRGVVVCATSDTPALVRAKSVHTATAVAEWFREQGARVVLLVDSLTRFARASREVALAAGEPPARRGFPPSVFAALPAILERAGRSERGSITALYTVLVEGDDLDEPVADEVRGIVDGHIVLSRAIAARAHFPAIDVSRSLSRLMDALVSPSHRLAARRLRELLAIYETKRDLLAIGGYEPGRDTKLDDAVEHIDAIEAFLKQSRDEHPAFASTVARLEGLAR